MRLAHALVVLLALLAPVPLRAEAPLYAGIGLIQRLTGGERNCGGVLIASDLVLTAAHCLTGWKDTATPGFSFAPTLADGRPGAPVPVAQVWLHPAWLALVRTQPGRPQTVERDFGLAHLASPVPASIARPVQLGAAPARLGAGLQIATFPGRAGSPLKIRSCPLKLWLGGALVLDCKVHGGESGGAVLNQTDAGPVLVGIVSSRIDTSQVHLTLAPRAGSRLRELLDFAGIYGP